MAFDIADPALADLGRQGLDDGGEAGVDVLLAPGDQEERKGGVERSHERERNEVRAKPAEAPAADRLRQRHGGRVEGDGGFGPLAVFDRREYLDRFLQCAIRHVEPPQQKFFVVSAPSADATDAFQTPRKRRVENDRS